MRLKNIFYRLMIGGLGIFILYVLTPVFYLVGHVVEWGIYLAINYVADVFYWLMWMVKFLLLQCEYFVSSFMPSFVDYFGIGREAKIAIGFITCISFLAYLKLRLGKGDSHGQD